MLNIFIQKLKEQRNSVIIYIVSLVGYTFLLISMYPSMQKAGLDELIKSYPEQIGRFFSDTGIAGFATIEGFLSMEFLSFFFILIVAFYIGSAAGSAIAGQIEKKTIDFNLSQPISRTKMLLAEVQNAMLYTALIAASTSVSIYLLCGAYHIDISSKAVLGFFILSLMFLYAHYGIAILLSSLLKSKINVMLLVVGFSLASYVFLSLTRLVEKLEKFKNISIYRLYDPEKILTDGKLNLEHLIILAGIFIFLTLAGIFIFNKKNI